METKVLTGGGHLLLQDNSSRAKGGARLCTSRQNVGLARAISEPVMLGQLHGSEHVGTVRLFRATVPPAISGIGTAVTVGKSAQQCKLGQGPLARSCQDSSTVQKKARLAWSLV